MGAHSCGSERCPVQSLDYSQLFLPFSGGSEMAHEIAIRHLRYLRVCICRWDNHTEETPCAYIGTRKLWETKWGWIRTFPVARQRSNYIREKKSFLFFKNFFFFLLLDEAMLVHRDISCIATEHFPSLRFGDFCSCSGVAGMTRSTLLPVYIRASSSSDNV